MAPPRVLVVGSANMDLVIKTPRMPVAGETIMGGDFRTVRGGKGANQAVACARLGAETWMLGCVGRDVFGDELVRGLAEDGVKCEYIGRDDEAPSGIAVIIIDHTGENSIVVAPGANMELSAADVAAVSDLGQFDVALLQLEVPLAVVAAMVGAARDSGVLTVLDAGPPRSLSAEIIRAVDVLSPNQTEARTILGQAVDSDLEPSVAADELVARGARNVALKLGAEGAIAAWPDHQERVPAFKVDPVDTTGAGDAFTAALAVSMAEGKDLVDATRMGTAAGALAATVFGAAPSMPTREAVERLMKEGEAWGT